jgi:hypothetical protein
MHDVPTDWAWRIATLLIALGALLVSIASYIRAGRLAKASIPPPVVEQAGKRWVVISMQGDNGKRYGIAAVEASVPITRMFAHVEVDRANDHIVGYKAPDGAEARRLIDVDPPTTKIIFSHPPISGATVRVKVVSRGDDGVASWFTLPVF